MLTFSFVLNVGNRVKKLKIAFLYFKLVTSGTLKKVLSKSFCILIVLCLFTSFNDEVRLYNLNVSFEEEKIFKIYNLMSQQFYFGCGKYSSLINFETFDLKEIIVK